MKTTIDKVMITIRAKINAPVDKIWEMWTDPRHIVRWNNASDEWFTPKAENDLRAGGKFLARMEARDGSAGFDFEGVYNRVEHHKQIDYTMADGRTVQVSFVSNGNETTVTEVFEAEQENPAEMQQTGWQAILDNFKKYVEGSGKFDKMYFEISINARVEKVFQTMFDDEKWREWTAIFSPSSSFKGSWEKGSKMLFLGADQDGKMGGMVSRIKDYIPNKYVSIEHLGMVQNGEEIMTGPEVESWSGAMENYTFLEANGKTLLSIDTDSTHEFKAYFLETWPKALEKLKELCEK